MSRGLSELQKTILEMAYELRGVSASPFLHLYSLTRTGNGKRED